MHVIIDFNCLSSCLSCLIKDSLGSVLFSEVQWLKHTHGKTPLSGIISTTDEHGYAEYIHSLPILQFYTKALLNFGVRGYFDKKKFGVRVFFSKINLRDSGFFCTFAADFQIVTIWKEYLKENYTLNYLIGSVPQMEKQPF